MHWTGSPNPTVAYGYERLWDDSMQWADINTSEGVYNFSTLDSWLHSHSGTPMLYEFGRVPQWASADPTLANPYGPGQAGPPADVNADGSGADLYWQSFVTALVTNADGRIAAYELWNEPNNAYFWNGNYAQLARMANDAVAIIRTLDPQAIIISPSGGTWMSGYYAAGGPTSIDAISFHAYTVNPEDVVTTYCTGCIIATEQIAAQYGLQSKQLWMTEGAWINNPPSDPAAFVSRYYPIIWSQGVVNFDWYEWNNPDWGTLLGDKPAITAWTQVHNWLLGATMTTPCSVNGYVWTCGLTRPGGYKGLIVWDIAGSASYAVTPGTYTQYQTITGSTVRFSGRSASIGTHPILLENMNP
jgi:hypothetical protein